MPPYSMYSVSLDHNDAQTYIPNHPYDKAVVHFTICSTWANWLQESQHSITSIQQKPEQYKMLLTPMFHYPDQDLNPGPPEYKAGVLTT
jgi:hypothetical protein